MKRISHLQVVSGRYIVVSDTPDNGRSTYHECWGSMARYDARAVAASDSLGAAVMMAAGDRYAEIYDRQTGRKVGKKRLTAAGR